MNFQLSGILAGAATGPGILEGWHINKDFMWPYMLAAYLLSPLIIGLVFHPSR